MLCTVGVGSRVDLVSVVAVVGVVALVAVVDLVALVAVGATLDGLKYRVLCCRRLVGQRRSDNGSRWRLH